MKNIPPYKSFEQGPIRPPSEAESLLIRITRNCPWNRCTFCPVYKDEKFYQVDGKETFDDSEMIHIVGLGFDGVVGKSVIEAARESIGLGLALSLIHISEPTRPTT